MNSPFHRHLYASRKLVTIAATSSTLLIGFLCDTDYSKSDSFVFGLSSSACDSAKDDHPLQWQQNKERKNFAEGIRTPSLWSRTLACIGILQLPRILTRKDPVLKISDRFLRKRQSDEEKMRKLVTEDVPRLAGLPDFEKKIAVLRQEIFELAYGKGVTAQEREDFLIRYGCTGFTDVVLQRLVELCATRGLVEIGAGHGQWQKALTDAYITTTNRTGQRENFDFVLSYDNNSNLPLNTHVYNQYTRPYHEYFGNVQILDSDAKLTKVLQSWACRGRALLLVYPPPGSMAIDALKIYSESSPDNDILIYVGEGRGGANGDEAFFDFLENGQWMIIDILEVLKPPGNKGCEKLYIMQKIKKEV